MERKKKSVYGLGGLFAFALLLGLDQLTKWFAAAKLKGTAGIAVIPDVFELFYLENRGAAFGMFANRQWVFVMVALIMCAAAIYVYLFTPPERHYHGLRACTMLIAAGAVGNMIDRIVHHYVIDFLYVSLIDFPVFNIADCYVVIGSVLLVVLIFTLYSKDDFSFLDPGKESTEEKKRS